MKNFEILNAVQSLNSFEMSKTTLPVRVGYTILQNRQKMRQVIEPFEEMRNSIFQKYAKGKPELKQTDEGYAECAKEMDELGNEEQELDLKKIKLSDIENVELPAKLISALMCMLEE